MSEFVCRARVERNDDADHPRCCQVCGEDARFAVEVGHVRLSRIEMAAFLCRKHASELRQSLSETLARGRKP